MKPTKKRKDEDKKRKKRILLWAIFPLSLLGLGGITMGTLVGTGVLRFGDSQPNDIKTIFTDGSNPYQWSNSATNKNDTSTQDSSKEGSSTKHWQGAAPTNDAIRANLNSFLDRSNQGGTYRDVLNDLTYSAWALQSGSYYNLTVSTIQGSESYVGTFTIGLYWDSTHDLPSAITDRIVDFSSISTTKTAGDVLTTVATNNPGFNPDAVEIGYIPLSGTTFNSYSNTTEMTKTTLADLWTTYTTNPSTLYAYRLAIHAKPGGYYTGNDVYIYLKLQRITFNSTLADTLFGSTRNLNNNGGNDPFQTAPNLEQASRAWRIYYSTHINNASADYATIWANFYTSNPTNCSFAFDSGKLKLIYADGNQFYTNNSSTLFGLNIISPTELENVFNSDEGDVSFNSVTTSNLNNALKFISAPIANDRVSLINTIAYLKEKFNSTNYAGKTFTNFNGADFTSMYIQYVNPPIGTTCGVIGIKAINGSLFYAEDPVEIGWTLWNQN